MIDLMDMASSSRNKKSTIEENSSRANIMEKVGSIAIVTNLKDSMSMVQERREPSGPIG